MYEVKLQQEKLKRKIEIVQYLFTRGKSSNISIETIIIDDVDYKR